MSDVYVEPVHERDVNLEEAWERVQALERELAAQKALLALLITEEEDEAPIH